jgi:thiol-disulfide isomerase/thioredoxin
VNNHFIELNEANFDREVLNATQPVLVQFWADWSAPCKAMAPMLESVAEDARTVSGKLLPRLECQAVTVPSLGCGCVEAMVMGRSSPLPERGIFHQKAERLLKKVFPTIY